jgi:hypothetical protein
MPGSLTPFQELKQSFGRLQVAPMALPQAESMRFNSLFPRGNAIEIRALEGVQLKAAGNSKDTTMQGALHASAGAVPKPLSPVWGTGARSAPLQGGRRLSA